MIEERKRMVDAAKSWIGTPYHHRAFVKGAGVDCATLIAECAYEAGILTERVALPHYTSQWNQNQNDEAYLNVILKYLKEIPKPSGPGDVVLWQFGKTFSHGAIIVDWPFVIHAVTGRGVEYEDVSKCMALQYIGKGTAVTPRPVRFFSRWAE